MLPKIKYWLKTQPARFRQAYNSVSMPPLMRMALLIASAAVPFVVFALFQVEETPPQTATTQEPADLRQQVPLQFPFGNLEASPSPSPSPSPTASPSAQPTSTRTRRTAAPPPAPQPPPPPVAQPEPQPEPEPSASPDTPAVPASESPAPSPSPKRPSPSPSKAPPPPGSIGECNDGKDNDDDDKIDMQDPGCFNPENDDE